MVILFNSGQMLHKHTTSLLLLFQDSDFVVILFNLGLCVAS